MPETRGKALEEIQEGFRSPSINKTRLGRKMLDGARSRRQGSGAADANSNESRAVSRTDAESRHSIVAPQRVATNTV